MAPPKTAKHGTESRWRAGCTCARCYKAHLTAMKEWRHGRSFDAETAGQIVDMLSAGRAVVEVTKTTGASWQAIVGRGQWDKAWQNALDDALLRGRNPDLEHGTEMAYRHGRCRCPECRVAHSR